MKTFKNILLPVCFFGGFALFIPEYYAKADFSLPIIISAFALTCIFIVISICEVSHSHKIERSSKTLWIIGFLVIFTIAGAAYICYGRRRILNQ